MALTGCHVVCAYAGSSSRQDRSASILGRPIWSTATPLAANGITPKAAVANSAELGDAVFHIRAAADGYGVIDPAPDENNADHPRVALPAGETVTVYVKKGDKLKYVVA